MAEVDRATAAAALLEIADRAGMPKVAEVALRALGASDDELEFARLWADQNEGKA